MPDLKHSLRSSLFAAAVAAFAAPLAPEASAEEIFHWVDEDGGPRRVELRPDGPVLSPLG